MIKKKKGRNRKSNDENGSDKQKKIKKEDQERKWKTRPISVCECLIVMFKMLYYSLYI